MDRKRVLLALARVDVERAGNLPPDAAAAWLYERIREGAIETWRSYFRAANPNHPNKILQRARVGAPERVDWIDKLPPVPTDGFLERCEVVVEDVRAAIARAFPKTATPSSAPVKNARNAGRRPDPKFEPVMVKVGAWLAEEGERTEAEVVSFISGCLADRDEHAAKETLANKAKIALGAFREFKARN
ncbi:MAG: hypothetical protein AAFW98_17810, partial [Pseudomonadota bacterium]